VATASLAHVRRKVAANRSRLSAPRQVKGRKARG